MQLLIDFMFSCTSTFFKYVNHVYFLINEKYSDNVFHGLNKQKAENLNLF